MNLKTPLLAVLGVIVAAVLVVGGLAVAGVFDRTEGQAAPTTSSSTTVVLPTTTTASETTTTSTEAPATTTTTDAGIAGDATADAGEDQFVVVGALVTLDGTASSDPLGSELTYRWFQTGGPSVTGDDRFLEGPTPTFTAPVDPAGLIFELTVNDGTTSEPSTVRVQVVVDEGVALFVDPAATVDGLEMGTIEAPFTSIDSAFDILGEVGAGTVYVTRTFEPIVIEEFFVIPLGVSIVGGFDDEFLYAFGRTTFRAEAPMYIAGPGGSTLISQITLYGQHEGFGAVGLSAEAGDEGGSIEIRRSNITGPRGTEGYTIAAGVTVAGKLDVTITESVIRSGNGTAGTRGASGTPATKDGVDGNDANKATGGKGGPGLNGGDGGSALGGNGGNGVGEGGAGGGFDADGQQGAGGDVPLGGDGGNGGQRSIEIAANAGTAGSPGGVGASGGGGGGGGGTIGLKGGGGGEGGTGGAAGQGGNGGGGGGASIGLFVSIEGDLLIVDSEIIGGNGGSGGSGGGGSFGAQGGYGGRGAQGSCSFLGCGAGQAGAGGDGAGGSRGSQGGDGGGGAGGNSYGIYLVSLDGSLTIEGSTVMGGRGGNGGRGGENGSMPQKVGFRREPTTGFVSSGGFGDRGADGGSSIGIYATAGDVDTSEISVIDSEVAAGEPGSPGAGAPANSGFAFATNY